MTVEQGFPTVESAVAHSTDLWARDLQSLFEHAKDRFGDVCWETEYGGDRSWGHKAVIYARAPKAFKDRYFITRSFSRSPTLRSPSPSGSSLAPPSIDTRGHTPPSAFRDPAGYLSAPSRTSVHTVGSDHTLRAGANGVLLLAHGDTPELFQAQLEWLYTGEGFGDVVEWISEDEGSSVRDSLGRRGNQAERRDRLGQDLTYMWRSKLYVDVRIHLTPLLEEEGSSDSDDSNDSLSSTCVFTAHRFILVSRSPYFSSLLLNHSAFRPTSAGIADIHLPTPPFSPASLHFCLGWMYAGHLDFSNRSYDLGTAFQIHRAAAYLQLDSLVAEVQSRIVWDFCHGLDTDICRCKKCSVRVARVWKFATEPDVAAIRLADRSKKYLVTAWGDCWGKEVGSLDEDKRKEVIEAIRDQMSWRNIIPTFRSIMMVRNRMEAALRSKGGSASTWIDPLGEMVEQVEDKARDVLVKQFERISEGKALWELVQGKGFSDDLLEEVLQQLVQATGMPVHVVHAPRIYQVLVSNVLLKVDLDTLQTLLAPRSIGRHRVEAAKEGILGHIRRRWMQIREEGGFDALENWSLKEIAGEIEIDVDELLETRLSPPAIRQTPAATRSGIPRTVSQSASLSQTSAMTLSLAQRSSARSRPSIPTEMRGPVPGSETAGLRRLRLSSSASTASTSRLSLRSVTSPPSQTGREKDNERDQLRIRAVSASATSLSRSSITEPSDSAARAVTAKESRRISIGPARRAESGAAGGSTEMLGEERNGKRDSLVLSGPIRQLKTRTIGSTGSIVISSEAGPSSSSKHLGKDTGKGKTKEAMPQSTAKPSSAVRKTPSTATLRKTPSTATLRKTTSTSTINKAHDVKGKGKAVSTSRPSSPKPTPSVTSVRTARTTKSQITTPVPPRAAGPSSRRTSTASSVTSPPLPDQKATKSESRIGLGRTSAHTVGPSGSPSRLTSTASTAPSIAMSNRGRLDSDAAGKGVPQHLVSRIADTEAEPRKDATRTRLASTATAASSIRPSTRDRLQSTASTKSDSPSVASRRTVIPKTSAQGGPALSGPHAPTAALAKSKQSLTDLKKDASSISSAAPSSRPRVSSATAAATSQGKGRIIGPGRDSHETPSLSTTPSIASLRTRTASQATTATVRSTRIRGEATSRVSDGGSMQPPPVPPKDGAASSASREESHTRSVSSSSRPATLIHRSSRPPPSTGVGLPTLLSLPLRSASTSTAEETEARTPRTSDHHDPAIRRVSDTSDDYWSPFAGRPPVSMNSYSSRDDRKISSGSVRSRQHPAAAFDPPARIQPPIVKDTLPEGVQRFRGPGISLKVGIPCIVNLNTDGRRGRFRGQVKFIGYMDSSTRMGSDMAQEPWIGVETESLDRIGVPTLETGVVNSTHYFNFTAPDPSLATSEGEQEKRAEQKAERQRKIQAIREGMRIGSGASAGTGGAASKNGAGSGVKGKVRNGSLGMGTGMGIGMGYPSSRGQSRAPSPFLGHGQQAGSEWISGGMRALFVRPSEVVYVVGAD